MDSAKLENNKTDLKMNNRSYGDSNDIEQQEKNEIAKLDKFIEQEIELQHKSPENSRKIKFEVHSDSSKSNK